MNLDLFQSENRNLFTKVKTLRDTLNFSYPIYSDYKRVLPYTDLPYGFDQKKKP